MVFFTIIKTLLLCSASLTLLAIPSSGQYYNHLLSGESLKTGGSLVQGLYLLLMQEDCNLCLYDNGEALWCSGTYGHGAGCYASMQTDGNFVVYDKGNNALWASNTNIGNGYYNLILQKDRNLVLYSNPIWATETNKVGFAGVVIAPASNGTVRVSGAQQNKVREMIKIMELKGDE